MSNFRLICGTDESTKLIVNLDFIRHIELDDGEVSFFSDGYRVHFKTDLTKIEQVRYLLNNRLREDVCLTTQSLLEALNPLKYPLPANEYSDLGVVYINGEYKLRAKKREKYQPKTKQDLKALCANTSIHLGDIDTSLINDMSWLFRNSTRTNEQFEGIETWDVSNVEDMYGMFYRATSFNQPLNNWNVSNVEDMSQMFQDAISFNQPLDKWDVSNVKYMSQMFCGANLFNQDLNSWSMDNREDTAGMFDDAEAMDLKNAMWYFMKGGENER